MAIGQKHIAERLGVSIALVSRVLSGRAEEIGIAPSTVRRVLEAASEMGYVPSAAALSLKGKQTQTIGVVVYDFMDPYFGLVIRELQRQANMHGYTMVLTGFINRSPDEASLLPLHKHAIDGLVIIGTDLKSDWLTTFPDLPVTRIGHGGQNEPSTRIATDEQGAGRQLLEYVRGQGGKQLAYAGAALPAHRLRAEWFVAAADALGLKLPVHMARAQDPFAAGEEVAQTLLGASDPVDTLLCATDQVAMGALHVLVEAGIRVPEDIRLTGFDDIPSAAQFHPSITTFRQPIQEMAKAALMDIVTPTAPVEKVFSGQLVPRNSA